MSSVEELKAQAVGLGFTGVDVGQYVLQQQKFEREERAREREERAREREDRKLKEEREERAREREDRKLKEEREFELSKLRLEKDSELKLAQLQASSKSAKVVEGENIDRPRLPAYKDGEDIASYITRFERIADLLKLDEDLYAVRLGALLSGKAGKVYSSLSPQIISDYDLLKKALLKSFCKTSDGFRQDFRSSKIQPGETYQQFSIHLKRLFEQWLEASKVGSSYDALMDFMVYDQFLSSLSPDLRLFVKERGKVSLEEAVQLADDWASARNAYPKTSYSMPGNKKMPKLHTAPDTSKGPTSSVKCHHCGEEGHIRPRCPKNPRAFKRDNTSTLTVGFCLGDKEVSKSTYCVAGTINGSWTSTILRDTGCSSLLVSEEALPDVDTTNCRQLTI